MTESQRPTAFPALTHWVSLSRTTLRPRSSHDTSVTGIFKRRSHDDHLGNAGQSEDSNLSPSYEEVSSQRYYDKKRAQGKTHNQAIRALGRHLCRVMFRMLKQQRPYQLREPATTAVDATHV